MQTSFSTTSSFGFGARPTFLQSLKRKSNRSGSDGFVQSSNSHSINSWQESLNAAEKPQPQALEVLSVQQKVQKNQDLFQQAFALTPIRR